MSDYEFDYIQYKKKLNKKNNNFTILFLSIILLLGCIVFLKPINFKTHKLFFVKAGEFQVYNDAKNFSQEISKNGHAGYIYFDENYHILISFHSSKKEANSSLKKFKARYKNASIFTIEKKGFTYQKSFTKHQNKTLKNFINDTEKISLKLEQFFSSFFKDYAGKETYFIQIENLKTEYENTYNKLLKSFMKTNHLNVAKKHASNMLICLSNLTRTTNQNHTALIKYEIINFIINRHQFLSCF